MLSFNHGCLALVLFRQFVAPHYRNTYEKYAVGSLPYVDFKLPHSWAGQIGIPGTENDELFFWLFETEDWTKSDNLISINLLSIFHVYSLIEGQHGLMVALVVPLW